MLLESSKKKKKSKSKSFKKKKKKSNLRQIFVYVIMRKVLNHEAHEPPDDKHHGDIQPNHAVVGDDSERLDDAAVAEHDDLRARDSVTRVSSLRILCEVGALFER